MIKTIVKIICDGEGIQYFKNETSDGTIEHSIEGCEFKVYLLVEYNDKYIEVAALEGNDIWIIELVGKKSTSLQVWTSDIIENVACFAGELKFDDIELIAGDEIFKYLDGFGFYSIDNKPNSLPGDQSC